MGVDVEGIGVVVFTTSPTSFTRFVSTVASISGNGALSSAHPASTKTTATASKVLIWGNNSMLLIPSARRAASSLASTYIGSPPSHTPLNTPSSFHPSTIISHCPHRFLNTFP